MPKYDIHLYPIVRVTVRDVEAEDQVAAIKKAEEIVDLNRFFHGLDVPHILSVEYADDSDGFLVDEDGDTQHQRTASYDASYVRQEFQADAKE